MTMDILMIYDNEAFIVHAGDARILSYNSEMDLEQLTEDDTSVYEMVVNGLFTKTEAMYEKSGPKRHFGRKRGFEYKTGIFDISERPRILMTTDGLTDVINEDKISRLLHITDPRTVMKLLRQVHLDPDLDSIQQFLKYSKEPLEWFASRQLMDNMEGIDSRIMEKLHDLASNMEQSYSVEGRKEILGTHMEDEDISAALTTYAGRYLSGMDNMTCILIDRK